MRDNSIGRGNVDVPHDPSRFRFYPPDYNWRRNCGDKLTALLPTLLLDANIAWTVEDGHEDHVSTACPTYTACIKACGE